MCVLFCMILIFFLFVLIRFSCIGLIRIDWEMRERRKFVIFIDNMKKEYIIVGLICVEFGWEVEEKVYFFILICYKVGLFYIYIIYIFYRKIYEFIILRCLCFLMFYFKILIKNF